MTATGTSANAFKRFFGARKTLRWLVWASLASQILIVFTGGLVRLTGSGLGCPTWPKCTDDSLVNVPEQGIHGFIEFGNRLLTFVLLVIAILTLVACWLAAKHLRKYSVALIVGILAQAVLGGITVLFQLNPWIVGGHFVLSGVLIVIASVLVWRFFSPRRVPVAAGARNLAPFTSFFGAVTVMVGVLVTGAGPHAGDSAAARNGLALEVWQHYHSYPGYLLLALLFGTLFFQWRARELSSLPGRVTALTLIVSVIQAVIGIAQARLGVPAELVAAHILLAAVLCSLLAFNQLANRSR